MKGLKLGEGVSKNNHYEKEKHRRWSYSVRFLYKTFDVIKKYHTFKDYKTTVSQFQYANCIREHAVLKY